MNQQATSRRALNLVIATLLLVGAAQAADPCAGSQRRALVLSGGGPKGAFQAGAAYHLVVHRGCDFHEFSGISVGALNATFLAQAKKTSDDKESHVQLVEQAEGLVSLWDSIKGPKDVAKGRRLATLRFGMLGLESLNDFTPLRKLLENRISLDKLAEGRPVRVGVINFYDGGYREVSFQSSLRGSASPTFHDYLYASAVLPVLGKMPRIREAGAGTDPGQEVQFGDGNLRHITPVAGYFPTCGAPPLITSLGSGVGAGAGRDCDQSVLTAEQRPLEQLFVLVTSPYMRDSDSLAVGDPKSLRSGTRVITKGPQVLNRTLALMVDATYRQDLDFLRLANDMLRWRRQAYDVLRNGGTTERVEEVKLRFNGASAFPFESFNRDADDPEAPSLPYEIGLVIPEKEYAPTGSLLVFSPPMIREQLYCGCMAADQVMQESFGQASLADRCAERFPPLATKKNEETTASAQWHPGVCQQ